MLIGKYLRVGNRRKSAKSMSGCQSQASILSSYRRMQTERYQIQTVSVLQLSLPCLSIRAERNVKFAYSIG